ncbi:MAG TPA: hypothetical protein VIY27_03550 [Myxococcota bacterium]
MRSAHYERLQEVLADGNAMLRLVERIGRFGIREEEAPPDRAADALPARHRDAIAAQSGYFQERLFGGSFRAAGVDPFLENAAFAEAALHLYGRPIVRPVAVTANLMLPGQQLALHSDVPEFRGIPRDRDPAWLSIAMHHSGLFDDWRIATATAIAWFGNDAQDGELVFYPDGPYGRSVAVPPRHNSAIVFDTDSTFHGVDRRGDGKTDSPSLEAGMTLRFAGDGAWVLDDGAREMARYAWSELRLSVCWRAHCFFDADDERKARENTRDLSRERLLEILSDDLRARGRIGEDPPDAADLARTIAVEYVKFPPGAPSAARSS